jgi:hypothetical protein
MPDELQTSTVHTKKVRGKDVALGAGEDKAAPGVTEWKISYSEPLIEHELAAARQIAGLGLVTAAGSVQQSAALLVKGQVYLQLLGKSVTKTEADKDSAAFTPTPDQVNRMPKSVLLEFAMDVEYGRIPDAKEADAVGEA